MSPAVNILINTPIISDTLRWSASISIFAKVMKQYDGSAVMQFFRLFNMLVVAQCSETRLFRYLTS